MEKLRNAITAGLLVAAAIGLTAALTAVINTQSFLGLYTHDFHFRPGSRFAARMIESIPAQDKTCLIIGSSTAREGLDAPSIEKKLDGVKVINAATTGGNTSVHEIQAAILAQQGLHYRCIVMQMHPWLLYDNAYGVPNLVEVQYSALLNAGTLADLSFFQWYDRSQWRVMLDYVLPLKKHAVQMDMLMRNRMHGIHDAAFQDAMPLARFERFADELKPTGDSLYTDQKVPAETILRLIKAHGYDNPAIYGQAPAVASMQRAIDLLAQHTDRLVVIRMPDTTYQDGPTEWSYKAFSDVLARNRDKLAYVDCSNGFADDLFLDEAHLGTRGRAKLSQAFGGALEGVLEGRDKFRSGACRVGY